MNKNQVTGAAKEVAGKIQKEFGDLSDNHSQEAKGLAKELAGKAERKYGDAVEATEKAIDKASKDCD